jgi:hypothetical protein
LIEYVVTHHDEQYALAWATIEASPAGGFNVWPHPYQAADHRDQWPYWRPDESAARDAARDMCLDWAAQMPADSGYVIQVGDEEHVLHEEVVPPAATAPSIPRK